MANAREMLNNIPRFQEGGEVEPDPFPTIRESLAELGANPDKYEKILAQADEKLHWEKVFRPKTTLEVGAITLLAAAKQSGAEPNEYLSRLAPYFDSRIQSLPDLYNASGYVSGDAPTRAVLTRTARDIKGSASTLPHELEHTLQNKDFDSRYQRGKEAVATSGEQFGIHSYMDKVKVPGRPEPVSRFGLGDTYKMDLLNRLSQLPEEERVLIASQHPVFGDYLSSGNELFARIRAKDMLDSARGEDFLQTEMGQKLFPTDRDRSYFIGSTLPGVPKISPPYTFESTEQKKKPLTDPNTSYARQLYNKLTAPKEYQEGGEVTPPTEFAQALDALEANPEKYKSMYLYLLTKGDIANLDEKDLKQTDVAALGLMHAASLTNKEPEDFVQQLRPNMPNVPSRPADVRPNVMLQGSSGGYNTRMPGMNFDVPYVPENLMGRVGAETNVGEGQARAGVVAGAIRTPQTGVKTMPVMGDIGFNFPVGGGTFGLSATAPLNTPRARNTNVQATFTKRFQEGGEVTDEFPEEAGAMPGQSPSEAAKQMLYYKKKAAPPLSPPLSPKLPPGIVPDTGQLDGIYQEPTVASETARVFGMKRRDDRSIILPYYSRATGWVAPEMLYDVARAITAPSVAARGYEVAPEDAVNTALNFMGAGVGTSTAMKKPTGEGGKVVASSVLPSSTTARDDLAKMPKPSKVLAPANEIGFYSPTEAAALNLQRKSGPGQAFLNDIMKGENVRADEINAMGLDTFLKDKKNVTADEVRDYIAQNKIQLGETQYGRPKEDPVGLAKRKEVFDKYEPQIKSLNAEIDTMPLYMKAGDRSIANPRRIRMEDALNDLQLKRDAEADAAYKIPETKDTKFQGYALPGGANYREIVLTLPPPAPRAKTVDEAFELWKQDAKAGKRGQYSLEEINSMQADNILDILKEEYLTPSKTGVYKTRHWDETNPIAHLRVSDRLTDGKKTLLVDEVQSDWHQVARDLRAEEVDDLVKSGMSKKEAQASVPKDFGYKSGSKPLDWNNPEYVQARRDATNALNAFNSASGNPALQATLRAELDRASLVEFNLVNQANKFHRAVPDAPYKDDWYQLALRRAVKEAIDGGYDRVALPTGQRVAERFKLTNQVDEIVYGKYGDIYFYKNGDSVQNLSGKKPEELGAIIGKEVAQKLLNSEPNKYGARTLRGVDLEVGGEGMRKYYDEIYPGYLQKFGKKYGSQSGKTTVDVEGKPEPLFYMEITPKMREEFTSGIPMREGGEVRKFI